MHAHIYVSMQGSPTDLEKFQAKASKVVGGAIRRRAHAGVSIVNVPPDYWVSAETRTTAECVAARLSELLARMVPLMDGLQNRRAIHMVAHVVFEIEHGKELVGLRFPQQVITQLNEVGAHLDIDMAPPGRPAGSQ